MGPGDSDDGNEADRAMARYADGDDSAFDTVYGLLGPRLRAYARRLTHSPTAADGVVCEAFLRIIAARSRFVRGTRVLPWAMAIARCVAIDLRSR